jgi:hypothetical protein
MLYLAETEMHKIKDDSKIKIQINLNHHGPRQTPIICHLPDPPSFSLPTTFKPFIFNVFSEDCRSFFHTICGSLNFLVTLFTIFLMFSLLITRRSVLLVFS